MAVQVLGSIDALYRLKPTTGKLDRALLRLSKSINGHLRRYVYASLAGQLLSTTPRLNPCALPVSVLLAIGLLISSRGRILILRKMKFRSKNDKQESATMGDVIELVPPTEGS